MEKGQRGEPGIIIHGTGNVSMKQNRNGTFSRRLLANHVNKCEVATVTGATTELHGGRKRFNRKM